MKKYLPQQKGFVILFTILISTIILMIGLGIFSIATRQVILSGTAREAQYAFYAADAGVECALYAESIGVLNGSGGDFDCGAATPVSVDGQGIYPGLPYLFNVLVDGDQKSCAQVTVFDTDAGLQRRVVSQGYNICDTTGKPSKKNPLLVERVLDIVYARNTTPTTPSVLSPAATGSVSIPVIPLIE